ncbi:MAG: LytTR family transcriptional regulator [Clostridiales bacterium]|nr:LytTR family transcriptional regulator [Clostridiales bacterium]
MEVIIKKTEVNQLKVIIACYEENNFVRKLKKHIENYEERLRAKGDAGITYVSIQDILYVEAVDGKTFLYTQDHYYEIEHRLYELEEILDHRDFFRNSKSSIVNIHKIVTIRPQINRSLLVTLSNQEQLAISRRYVKGFKEIIGI